jgi:hypothetical protein
LKLTAKTVAAAILAATLMASVAALGQAASTTPSASQYQYGPGGDQYGKKIVICHKGKTIRVSRHALKGHRRHHDAMGQCAEDQRKHHGKGHDAAKQAEHGQSEHGQSDSHKQSGHDQAGHDDDHGQGQGQGKGGEKGKHK